MEAVDQCEIWIATQSAVSGACPIASLVWAALFRASVAV
jgi:hypothetical protein